MDLVGWQLRPQRGELWTDDGQVHRLQPRVMAVLMLLWRQKNRTVSRQELLAEIWQDRAVGDDALNRCVYSLRKILSTHPQLNIVTVPKQGYVLEYSAAIEEHNATPAQASMETRSAARPSRRWWLAWLGLGIAIFVVLVVLAAGRYSSSVSGPDTVWQQQPVSTLPGWEQDHDLSPSGGQLAFAWREHQADDWDIFVQALGGGAVLPISDPWNEATGDERLPRWSPDGAALAYIAYASSVNPATSETCRIVLSPSSGGAARVLAPCARAQVQSMDWSPDGRGLLLTVRHHHLAPAVWQWVALDDSEAPAIPELAPQFSVEDVRFDATGQRIAYTLSPALGVEDLYVFDFAQQQQRRLSTDQLKIHGLDWHPDQQRIVVASNRTGPFRLWQFSSSETAPPQALPGAHDEVDAPVLNAAGDIFYSARRSDANLYRWHAEQERWQMGALMVQASGTATQSLGLASTRYEWDFRYSPDGRWLSFISDRSGHAELWLAQADGRGLRQITNFAGPYTQSARWSPDSQQLVISAPVQGVYSLFHYDVAQDQWRALSDEQANDQAPVWSPDGQWIYFTSQRSRADQDLSLPLSAVNASAWRVWRMRPDGSDLQATAVAAKALQIDPDGVYLYSLRAQEAGLWRRPLAEAGNSEFKDELVLGSLAPVDWNNWWVGREFIYFIERSEVGAPRLQRYALASVLDEQANVRGVQTLARIPGLLYHSGLWVDEVEHSFVLSVIDESAADIYRLYSAKEE